MTDGVTAFKANRRGLELYADYERTGNIQLLQAAITAFREAAGVTPADHPGRPGYLFNLAVALQTRFKSTGLPADLDQVITRLSEAVDAAPADHPDRHRYLSSLANELGTRFQRTGRPADLDRAITVFGEAIDVAPANDPRRHHYLFNLGNSLALRFQRTGQQADSDLAITLFCEAINATPADHPERPDYLSGLGAALGARFQRTGERANLDQAVAGLCEAVDATPADHPQRPGYLSNLGAALRNRFGCTGQPADLDQAVARLCEAIDATPADHPDRPARLSNLGAALLTRFECAGRRADLDRAVARLCEAVDATPADHPDRPAYLSNLGAALQTRFESTGRRADLDRAVKAFRDGAEVLTASPARRLAAARGWGRCALLAGTAASAVKGYTLAIELLPLVVWHGLDQATRERHLQEWDGLASDAAAAAVAAGRPAQAVELLEAGRSILWTQALHLRHDMAELQKRAPAVAAALEASRAVLMQPAEQRMLQERRQAARDWDAAVDQVRRIKGFKHFLRPVPFTDLRAAAVGGPVVIVNISAHGSHALIVVPATRPTPDPAVLVVNLPAAPADTVTDQANTLLGALRRAGDPVTGWRTRNADRDAVFSILDWAWQAITEPVLTALGYVHTPAERIEDWPRVWWCPTGPAAVLPLHAAGRHPRTTVERDAMGETAALADIVAGRVISSYTPTLTALTQTRARSAPSRVRQLAVGVPEALSYARDAGPLSGVRTELRVVAGYLRTPGHATHLLGPAATRQAVLKALPSHSWLHMSCHGLQHPADPSLSALFLHDQPLTLADLAALNLRETDLAYLAACQTAAGDLRLLDEALHLARALQLVGYRHVLATLWSISDAAAPDMADTTYAHLLHPDPDHPRPTDRPQADRAPYALHHAVARLRKDNVDEPLLWAPYIHLGP